MWNSVGTEMPKPSSQIDSSTGALSDPAAFTDSQNSPFGAAGVADGAPGDLVAAIGELIVGRELFQLAVETGGVGEPYQARHLRAGR